LAGHRGTGLALASLGEALAEAEEAEAEDAEAEDAVAQLLALLVAEEFMSEALLELR